MINPETINLSTPPFLPIEQRKNLPNVSGIYFAIDSSDKIQYIGCSINIKKRWTNHHREKHLKEMSSVYLAWLEVSDVILLPSIEDALIAWFNPPLNRTFAKQKNLKTGRVVLCIKPLLDEANISANQLAEELRVSRNTVTNWMKGSDRGAFGVLVELRNLLSQKLGRQLTIEDLLKEERANEN